MTARLLVRMIVGMGFVVTMMVLPAVGPRHIAGATVVARSGVWVPTGNMTTARTDTILVRLINGKVLAVSGRGLTPSTTADLYDPTTGTWTFTGSMSTDRYADIVVMLPNGKVLAAGGYNQATNSALASAELYDPLSNTWTPTGSMSIARKSADSRSTTETVLPNGKVLIAGGCTGSGSCGAPLATAELFDPQAGTWTVTGAMTSSRFAATTTLLPNGKMLVAGGCGATAADGSCITVLATAELYDPQVGTWTTTGSMSTPRFDHTATRLPNGKVLVAGGCSSLPLTYGCTTSLASAELYDPGTGHWTTTGSMHSDRAAYAATMLPTGKVLVAGGCADNACRSAESFDPANGTWTPVSPLGTGRTSQGTVPISSSQVLVAGGQDTSGQALASAEIYLQQTASLTVSPTSDSFGQTIALTGTAFSPNELVNIYYNGIGSALVYTATTDASGSFVVTTTVKQGTYGTHTLYAVGQSSGHQAAATFFITPRLLLPPYAGTVGSTAQALGFGFAAGEQVQIFWNNPRQFLGTVTTNALGSFGGPTALTFTVPAGAPPGINVVYGIGQTSHATGVGIINLH